MGAAIIGPGTVTIRRIVPGGQPGIAVGVGMGVGGAGVGVGGGGEHPPESHHLFTPSVQALVHSTPLIVQVPQALQDGGGGRVGPGVGVGVLRGAEQQTPEGLRLPLQLKGSRVVPKGHEARHA